MGTVYRRYICAACGHEHREVIFECPRCGGARIYKSPWQIQYMAGGKRIRRSLPNCTKAQADRILKQAESEALAGEYGLAASRRWTVKRYIEDKWWPLHGSRLRSSRNYRYNLDRHIIPAFGDTLLERVTEAEVVAWRNEILDGGMSPATVNRLVYLLSGIYTKAVRWRDTRHHPVRDIEPLKEHNQRGAEYRLSAGQYHALLALVDTMKDWTEPTKAGMKAAIALAVDTCLRKENLFGLQWDKHIDMAKRTITIPGEETKNQNPVEIPMSETAYEVLSGLPRDLRSQVVLVGAHGQRLRKAHQNHWTELRAAMHKKDKSFPLDFHFHDLRATGASRLIAAGVPERLVMRLMNLKSTRVLSRYDRQAQDQLRVAVERVSDEWRHDTMSSQKKEDAS